MLDKIIVPNKHEAYLIYTSKCMVRLTSDVDVVVLLLWFLGHPSDYFFNSDGSVVIELRNDLSDDITMKIDIKEAA